MNENNNPVTPKDIIHFALDFAFKGGAINSQERDNAKWFVNAAHGACDALIREQKGPVNCYPLGYARDAMSTFPKS
jgi:hypothetical protein